MLTDTEASTLFALEKLLTGTNTIYVPAHGSKGSYGIEDISRKYKFSNKINRGNINPKKISLSLIYKSNIILIRVDTQASYHQNPDKTEILAGTPHIHVYKEGFDDSFAYELPPSFSDTDDLVNLLYDFLKYSKVINIDDLRIVQQSELI